MTASLTEGVTVGDLVKWEGPHQYSREVATIVANQTVAIGTFLEATSGGYKVCTTVGNAVGVALEAVTTEADETYDIPCLCRMAVVSKDHLVYGSLDEDAADAKLAALGIIPRTGTDEVVS